MACSADGQVTCISREEGNKVGSWYGDYGIQSCGVHYDEKTKEVRMAAGDTNGKLIMLELAASETSKVRRCRLTSG